VFLAYASEKGAAFIDRALYLPRAWTQDAERRTEAGIPEAVRFASKLTLAERMLARAFDAGVPARWVVADSFYGRSHAFRRWLEGRGIAYAVMIQDQCRLAPILWARRVWALPFLTALAPSERYDAERRRRHKALTDWAWQLLLVVRRWWPDRTIVAVADSGYAAIRLLARWSALPQLITVVTRLRLDAALYEPAPPRVPGQIGRPRQKGKRLPTLAARATDLATVWQAITVADWYGKGERTVALASETAIWYHTGLPPVPIRWVLIRDSQGKFATQALLCTDLTATPQQIIAWFVRRWQMETGALVYWM